MNIKHSIFFLILLAPISVFAQQTVRYDLYIADTTVSYSGSSVKAIAINGHIPGPEISLTEGDTAAIYVHNAMDVEASIHWHGIILPNTEDGVPYLTSAPIEPHGTHLYTFPIVQNGTYWYHAHVDLQEQSGEYGALILHKRENHVVSEYTVLLSDWTDEKPSEVLRTLATANDWYAIKKHATQNWGEALVTGYLGQKIEQEWLRMLPMDVSDVYYDALLTNGATEQHKPELKAGTKIKLRIINGSASTYFWLQYAGSKLTVVASDGEDVVPVEVDRMIIGIAETYDVIVTVPENMSYEFKATAEDRTKSTSLWLGDGMKMPAPILPQLKLFEGMKMMNTMMHLDGSMDAMGMQMTNQTMDMNNVMYPEVSGDGEQNQPQPDTMNDMKGMKNIKNIHNIKGTGNIETMTGMDHSMMDMNSSSDMVTLNYGMLRSTKKTALPVAPTRVLHFNLTGNMNRYQWNINNTALSDTDKILIHKGENIRIILNNQTMMRHPMHIHGHYFRILNGEGDYSPLKNVIDVMPMEIDTIEFAADYDGDWFFHCHILYHMMSGMGRVFSYANSQPNPQIDTIKNAWNTFLSDDKMWHFSTAIAAQSQGMFGKAMVMNRNYMFDVMGVVNYKGNYESETHFARYIDRQQFLKFYVGSDIRSLPDAPHELSNPIEKRAVATLGVQYLLPLFLQSDLRVDHTGRVRFQIAKYDMALTSRLRFDGMWNTDKEYELGLRYIATKRFSLSANYSFHFGYGAGISFTY